MTNSNFNFTLEKFTEKFDTFYEVFCNDDSHPESFFEGFYNEFIMGSKFLTDEVKQELKETIVEDCYELDEDEEDYDFETLIEEYSYFKEDFSMDLIDKNPELKEKVIPQLFFHISEMWMLSVIEDVYNGTY